MLYHLFDFLYGSPAGPYAYKDALFRSTCAMLMAFLVVWLLGPRVIHELKRRRIGDKTDFDHKLLNEDTQDKKNTPTMGGLLIGAAIFVSGLRMEYFWNH